VLTDNVNLMAMNLTNQVCSIAEVTKAVAGSDLMKKIEVDVRGEILELKETANGMTESLSVFAAEVTRVAREVGTEGRLGGQARVMNVGGTWKDLTDNVNVMVANVSIVLYHDGKWTDRCHLLVDAASAYDRCRYCTFTPTILAPFYSCHFTDGRCPGRSHTEDHRCPRFWRDAQLSQHNQRHD
jgi:HAMP domain-containing protein